MTQPVSLLPSQPEMLVEGMAAALFTTHNVIGIAIIAVILLQVAVVLFSLYMRPIRTWGQALKLLVILFAALVICCMTVWLLWQMERA